ncbi:Alpha/Beta hydrolase protein [Dendryphion nanum]|uniref:Alpha/Beta hydrolase protein n=1 Tax=Dendryphion nanum TaxID=256645 RepID=A0A9P9IFB4_9PLEO|nr:Alpha/Beta hydrolase protein [Dendryphion nanum]
MAAHLLTIALAAAPAFALPLSTITARDGISWWDTCEWFLPENLQCGTMNLPIDWNAPDGATFELRVTRFPRPSNTTTKSLGNLFINPGGPGGRASVAVAEIARGMVTLPSEILNSFDIIGVDPRGVGLSTPINCGHEIWAERVSLFPKTQAEFDRLVDKNKRLGESCIQKVPLSNHVDTISAAKDHEAVRKALGGKVTWMGLSYGSMLAAQYAALYPDNVRGMVLDGVLQHSLPAARNIELETTAYSTGLKAFFKWADSNDASPLKGGNAENLWYEIIKNATASPIPAKWCNDRSGGCYTNVTDEEFLLNAQGFLIRATQQAKINFANALIEVINGDATQFSSRLPFESNRDQYAGLAIGCQDWPSASSFKELQENLRRAKEYAPLTRGASQTYTLYASCAGWPAPLSNPPKKLRVKTKAPALLVNSLEDPSTSYKWALGMLDEIENRVLVTRKGDGHTSWGIPGETDNAINRFLLNNRLPPKGTTYDS